MKVLMKSKKLMTGAIAIMLGISILLVGVAFALWSGTVPNEVPVTLTIAFEDGRFLRVELFDDIDEADLVPGADPLIDNLAWIQGDGFDHDEGFYALIKIDFAAVLYEPILNPDFDPDDPESDEYLTVLDKKRPNPAFNPKDLDCDEPEYVDTWIHKLITAEINEAGFLGIEADEEEGIEAVPALAHPLGMWANLTEGYEGTYTWLKCPDGDLYLWLNGNDALHFVYDVAAGLALPRAFNGAEVDIAFNIVFVESDSTASAADQRQAILDSGLFPDLAKFLAEPGTDWLEFFDWDAFDGESVLIESKDDWINDIRPFSLLTPQQQIEAYVATLPSNHILHRIVALYFG